MSTLSDFLTQNSVWIATPLGTVIGMATGAAINAGTSKASDSRKAQQEDKTNRDSREHEQQMQREKRAYDACTELYTTASELLIKFIDVNGIFNIIRDRINTSTRTPDPKAADKVNLAESQASDMTRLGQAYTKVKFNAPKEIVGIATELYQSVNTIAQQITHPLAKAAATRAAGQTLDKFINAYRTYYGLEQYSEDDAKRDSASYLDILKAQVEEFLSEVRPTSTEPPNH